MTFATSERHCGTRLMKWERTKNYDLMKEANMQNRPQHTSFPSAYTGYNLLRYANAKTKQVYDRMIEHKHA